MSEVDLLIAQPELLAGTLSFVELDEVRGMARLGRRDWLHGER